ncbi:hypothetical protein HPB51_000536 [Rhipicephalus microplus]|uniref:Uncharacterized protein n=1 Tax=Rhipicephalus microplus TaxID=6941 RepID=A0A9J6EPS7_RHIMP|nr:hypothetical protein HPB51_000536 [Rhipicephalus microplus]
MVFVSSRHASDATPGADLPGLYSEARAALLCLDSCVFERVRRLSVTKLGRRGTVWAKQHVDDAVAALNGITTNMEKSLSESVEMLSLSLDQWSYLKRNFTAGLDGVKDMLPNVRKMVYSDIGAYFDHARVEVRENIGDCRPFYILYSKTVDAVCTHGFRRFGRWGCLKSVSTPFLTRPDDVSSVANTDQWCYRQSTGKEAMDNYSDL